MANSEREEENKQEEKKKEPQQHMGAGEQMRVRLQKALLGKSQKYHK